MTILLRLRRDLHLRFIEPSVTIILDHDTPTVCRLALKRILSFGGYELPAGQGFHITRKTFATRLLEALNKIDDISNALGHVRKETSEVYLERDEAGMRLCPIRFGSVSVC